MVCPCALGQNGGKPVPRIPKELKSLTDAPLSRDDIRKGKVRHAEVPPKDPPAAPVETRPTRPGRRRLRPMPGFLGDAMREH